MPTVSIITITYNAGPVLERTARSIIAQETGDYEWLVIDGGSTDDTLSLLNKYDSYVTRRLSEPDRGLYDAMNKGLRLARGRYVWFMNAGDEIHDPAVLPNLLDRIRAADLNRRGEPAADVYYSDALYVRADGSPVGLRSVVTPHSLPRTLTWQDMALGMKVCHQAFVVRRSIAPAYDITNLSADLDWEIRCLKAAKRVEWLDFVLCKYLVGGVSVQQHRRSLLGRFRVLAHHFGWLPTLLNHLRIGWRAVSRSRSQTGN